MPADRDKDKAPDERDPQTYAIVGAAIEVHRVLGPGFLEAVYQEALAAELVARGIVFEREAPLPVAYKGRTLSCTYKADFLCFGEVIVELKAADGLTAANESQVVDYLRASGLERGLVLNFGASRFQFKRLICSVAARAAGSPTKSE
jgi:GxxExxY protein